MLLMTQKYRQMRGNYPLTPDELAQIQAKDAAGREQSRQFIQRTQDRIVADINRRATERDAMTDQQNQPDPVELHAERERKTTEARDHMFRELRLPVPPEPVRLPYSPPPTAA